MKDYQKLFETAMDGHFRPGNAVTVLQNGDEIFPAMLEAIRGANSSIELVTYVYWHSKVAAMFADALCERSRSGVAVRLLIDAVGGAVMSTRMVGQLERAGVKIAWFRPLKFALIRRINHRTHRKILLVDGHIGFIGGVGIADEWSGNGSGPKSWRETHCRIEGPACLDLAAGFAQNWREATRERLPVLHAPRPAGDMAILTTASTVGPRPTAMERLFETAIAAADERLWITSAYFVPGERLRAALAISAGRGVDVRVLTNGSRSNHKMTLSAGRDTYAELLEAGVKIYEYQRTVLHIKLMTVDRAWATIGSANFDNRSLVLNDELNISVLDRELVAKFDRRFQRDLEAAREIRAASWARRGFTQRALERVARAFSHQL